MRDYLHFKCLNEERKKKKDYKVALVMPVGAVMCRLECVHLSPLSYLSLHNRNCVPVHMRNYCSCDQAVCHLKATVTGHNNKWTNSHTDLYAE